MALQVLNVGTGMFEAKVTRTGLFGEIKVQWKAGFPSGQDPPGFRTGSIVPNAGKSQRGTELSKPEFQEDTLKHQYFFIFILPKSLASGFLTLSDMFLYPGSLILAHGERNKTISCTAMADGLEAASYAIHLTNATSSSASSGAVRLRLVLSSVFK